MKHVVALHPPETGVAVGRGHGVPVAYVKIARGVRVHGHFVPLGTGIVVEYFMQAVFFPTRLPFAVNRSGVERKFDLSAAAGHVESPQVQASADSFFAPTFLVPIILAYKLF